MFKHLVFIFVLLSHGIPGYSISYYPSGSEQVKNLQRSVDTNPNCSAIAEEMSKMVAMSGKSNYYVRPRGMLFYVHDEPQFQKLLPVYKHKEIIEKGYLVTPNIGAHKFHPRKISWNNARKACNSEGGHLAIINSAFEEKILMCMLQERNINEAWVGLHDIFEEGDWVTVTDEAFENTGYTTWTPTIANLPDNYGGSQNCGVILKEGGLDDVNCAWTHSFFCEITL